MIHNFFSYMYVRVCVCKDGKKDRAMMMTKIHIWCIKFSINQIWDFLFLLYFPFNGDLYEDLIYEAFKHMHAPVKSCESHIIIILLQEIRRTFYIIILIILQCIKQRLKRSSSSLFTLKCFIIMCVCVYDLITVREGIMKAYWITYKGDYHTCLLYFLYIK